MRELGIDLGADRPRRFTDEDVRAADLVVTMGCDEACPVLPGKRYEDWPVEDPAGKDLATVRRVRDEIGRRVDDLVERLTARAPR
jgi:arsenate reductase